VRAGDVDLGDGVGSMVAGGHTSDHISDTAEMSIGSGSAIPGLEPSHASSPDRVVYLGFAKRASADAARDSGGAGAPSCPRLAGTGRWCRCDPPQAMKAGAGGAIRGDR